ncbi:purple acid phosphatase 22 [Selaginella moellendorffii]|nr:purple acid phosphatase 22 [Selaginella moellendorffii]|eukprot:XP_002978336.2 purple acid phosphatase 22 [Selaginella moellendorffii]
MRHRRRHRCDQATMSQLLPLISLVLLLLPSPPVRGQWLDPESKYSGHQTEYTRPNADLDLRLDEPDIAPNPLGGPEQVFISQADHTGTAFTISWSSNRSMGSRVFYSNQPSSYDLSATGGSSSYADYTSGNLHHVTISNLTYSTRYYYRIGEGGSDDRHLVFASEFVTPPPPGPDSSIKFAIVGDLGQTYSSNVTLSHIEQSGAQYLLNVGDFSYADGYQPRWDTWGRFMTRYTSKVPMVFAYGNHEIEFDNAVDAVKPHDGFLSPNTRFSAPWQSCGAVAAIYYSLNVGPVHIISLNSYVGITKYTPQYNWLLSDLEHVDRSVTPWVIIITHVPWYNTYNAHYMEGEVVRSAVEYFARKYRVDAIFSGHVHAYERFKRLYLYEEDECAPVYITIGDGGNREGPAERFQVIPKPETSVYREPSFGYGSLEIINSSLARWQWHRNQDKGDVIADSVLIESLAGMNSCPLPPQPSQPRYDEHELLQSY